MLHQSLKTRVFAKWLVDGVKFADTVPNGTLTQIISYLNERYPNSKVLLLEVRY